jgi:hypothetical protein
VKAFIDEHREVYGVEPICKVLPIAPSTYYVHAARQANPAAVPARAQRDGRNRGRSLRFPHESPRPINRLRAI